MMKPILIYKMAKVVRKVLDGKLALLPQDIEL